MIRATSSIEAMIMQANFSPSDAALSAFELAKRQPQFVLRFCIIYALVTMVGIAIMSAMGVGPALLEYQELARRGAQVDPARLMETLAPAYPGLIAAFCFNLVAGAVCTAMGLRKAVHDRDDGIFGLQFGGDEVRLLVASVVVSVILFGVIFGLTVLGSFIAMGNIAAAILIVFGALIVAMMIGTRLSLFGVITIAKGQISIVDSWTYTKGKVLRFMGAFLLWGIVALIFSVVFGVIGSLLAGALGAQITSNIPGSLALFLTPGWLLYALMSGLVSGFSILGFICIGSYAWHQMRGDLPISRP
ncbi:MAG: hypothetical protein HC777_03475 [Hyphomonadaceae bacterium]|nr:hypothetical protein [Hyphomonadaceae bacterium]